MYYYEVLVATMTYHGTEPLTYSAAEPLEPGALVRVSLRSRATLAVVLRKVSKPAFAAKPIAGIAPCPPLPAQNLELMKWLYAYYPAPLGAVVRQFVPPTEAFPKEAPTADGRRSTANGQRLPPLTADQKNALSTIDGPGTFLLHGITGSGKSRVYSELAARALEAGKSAMVLTPEIGLTAQLTQSFQNIFGEQRVYVLHSHQTAAQRRDIWYAICAATRPIIVIGPRSALFAPLRNIGIMVLDEAHSSSYKNESAPHYQAGRVAAKLAGLHGATLVLGSATPSIEDYYLAQAKHRPIVAMNQLAKTAGETPDASTAPQIVDMKQRDNFTRHPFLSNTLLDEVASALSRGEQSLLFLNRRGTANVVLCNQCGWQSLCPNCDLALTYHGDTHELRCHVCGYHAALPTSCPVCSNTEILFKSIGTKALVDALARLFPRAKIQRFDTDSAKSEQLEQHVSALQAGSADIIVGTQMVGKGLDLPKLSVVGVVSADSSLLIPDYTASEQTFQLISQVIGRVGRGHRVGHVVVQTYTPGNAVLQAALQRSWGKFYNSELDERRTYHFPPFTYLLKLQVLRASSASAEKAAQALAAKLRQDFREVTVDGPTPSFHPRERGKYSWQLLVRSPRRSLLTDIVRALPSGWSYDIDPINLL